MKRDYTFDPEKSRLLRETRGIGFEEIVDLIENGCLIGVDNHPNQHKYPGQILYQVDVGGYIYTVPLVRDGERLFLKTIFPSRKATKRYKKEQTDARKETH